MKKVTIVPGDGEDKGKGPLIPWDREDGVFPFYLLTHISCPHVKASGRSRADHPSTFAGK